jgi:hypothetical protein
MLWTGAAFFRAEWSTNACTYSTRRSGAAAKKCPTRYSGCEQRMPWMRELTSLKNDKVRKFSLLGP